MNNSIRFCLVLHNHQPVGNFDHVLAQAYQDSYLPFLDVFERYRELKISLHISGPLIEWLGEHHGEYLDRLANLVAAGRVEIIGGPYYEPILTMLPPRDRVGQMRAYRTFLERRLGAQVRGAWVPERVWEQSLTSDLVDAGVEYTVLDDFHFRNAGLRDEELHGYYVTEDDGRLLRVFPGSERLRYVIPFGEPAETLSFLRSLAERHPQAVAVCGDDGEKFGIWPGTHRHVYEQGWLRRFFDLLVENRHWVHTSTLAEVVAEVPPLGKIYLPDGSYREMTEWALPTQQQLEYEQVTHELQHDGRWPRLQQFVRGGFWRNFRVKYPEADEMYSRMMMVSRRCEQARREGVQGSDFDSAVRELYRGQCNCSYWHGAFGGIYLPHLRHAVFNHLIAADNLLDRSVGKAGSWVEATVDDYNFDSRQEVRLASDRLVALIAPARGGQLYELDVRPICLNLLATVTRRPEACHRKVLAGANQSLDQISSIHDRVVVKQGNLDQRLQYDRHPRKSLLDHFYDEDVSLEAVARGDAEQLGDFVHGAYETRLRRNPDRIQVMMSRVGNVCGQTVSITKGVTLEAGGATLEIAYLLEQLPAQRALHFSVEFNLAGLPAGADDRFFFQDNAHDRLGDLSTRLNLQNVRQLGLADQWQGIEVLWSADRPTGVWTYPVETVSQSEAGIELVHQSVVVQPHWLVRADANGRWAVTMRLAADTSQAERRRQPSYESPARALVS